MRVLCGGIAVDPGDVVVGDADGVVVGTVAQLERAIGRAEEIERTEAEIREGLGSGRALFDMSNYYAHADAVAELADRRLTLGAGVARTP